VEPLYLFSRRQRDGKPIFGLPSCFTGQRWLSSDGTNQFGLSHAQLGLGTFPLTDVGMLDDTAVETGVGHGYIDVYGTLGTMLILAERSRSDPAFQYETRDQAVIDRELSSVPGPEDWKPTTIELDGRPERFLRLDGDGDWIAFHDFGNDCVWIHAQQPDGEHVAIAALVDVTGYLNPGRDAHAG
jgi:hypothetical protein